MNNTPPEVIIKKIWMVFWLIFGIFFIVASYGDGAVCAAMSMLCGFMVARNMADLV